MILTTKQEEGLRIAVERYRAHESYTCVAGFAGSGKSTLIKFIVSALNIDPEDVCYVSFTGKAATVLRQKGCENSMTAHKLLYFSSMTKEGKFIFKPRPVLEHPYKLIVVDEISMLPKPLWDLLLSHKIYVIALGDPSQLPPVSSDDDNHVLDNPHVFLDEVMRQAQDSEIIRLSMWVREGKPLKEFPAASEEVIIMGPGDVNDGVRAWADQILCATNNKRNEINQQVRQSLDFGAEPQIGDKIIGLTNHWSFESATGEWPLTNGTIGTITEYDRHFVRFPSYISEFPIEYMETTMSFEDDEFRHIPIDYHYLTTGIASLTPQQIYKITKNKRIEIDPPYDFAYAYAITVWKAQGSEWDKVLLYEENYPFDADTHRKYLYTGITRGKNRVVVVKK